MVLYMDDTNTSIPSLPAKITAERFHAIGYGNIIVDGYRYEVTGTSRCRFMILARHSGGKLWLKPTEVVKLVK